MTCSTSLPAILDDSQQERRSNRPAHQPTEPEEFPLTGDCSITRACGLWFFQHDWQDIALVEAAARVTRITVLESNH